MIAANLMSPNPVTLHPDDDISTAVTLLQERPLRHLPVLNDDGELVGMVSDRDVRALLVPHFFRQETVENVLTRARAPVSTIMSSNVVTVSLEDDVSLITQLILEHNVGALPVVDGDGTVVGIVSYVDLLRHYLQGED